MVVVSVKKKMSRATPERWTRVQATPRRVTRATRALARGEPSVRSTRSGGIRTIQGSSSRSDVACTAALQRMRFLLRGATAASQSAGQDVTARIHHISGASNTRPVEEAREKNF